MNQIPKDILYDSLPELRQAEGFYAGGYPLRTKMVVLDDDPTGVQTVHDVNVYTDWTYESMKEALLADDHVFFVLTNSRGLSAADSKALHEELMENLCRASKDTNVVFTVLSRSDSTLRGHYPMETEVIREGLKKADLPDVDGEIIAPFFPEGGRYTIGDVHYVQEGDMLTPAGLTEFARDTTFGYRSSNLIDWVHEKNPGMDPSAPVHSISIDDIRLGGPEIVADKLMNVKNFEKVIVNSADYADMEIFVLGLYRAMAQGKRFLFRVAAGLVRVMACIDKSPLLTGKELVTGSKLGGLVIVGSHVKKTTTQLENLLKLEKTVPIVFDVHSIEEGRQEEEIANVVSVAERAIRAGETAVIYTTRTVVKKTEGNSEENLKFSLSVSDALVAIVKRLSVMPAFIIAKGGITSSDIGVKGLSVRRARVAGQVLPGIPVWKLGEESRYPGVHYVIFPGNVGDEMALSTVVSKAQNA